VAAVAVLLCASGPRPAHGQVPPGGGTLTGRLTGTVVDRQSDAPVPGARIYLLDPATGARRASVASDSAGAFTLPPVPQGSYGLHVERIGYQPVSDSLTLVQGDEEDLTIYLVPEAIDLEPMVVRVPRTVAYYMRHFESRRATGSGTFITRDQIERRRARQTSELLHSLGGVRVQYSTRGEASLFVRGTCRPQVYIDGVAIHQSVSIDMAVLPDDIEGMEVYSNASMPAQYASLGACAAILVWTRPAVRGEAKKAPIWKFILTGGVFLTVMILRH
jgi:hypothetical protein